MDDSEQLDDIALDDLEGFEDDEEVQAYLALKDSNHKRFNDLVAQGAGKLGLLPPGAVISLQVDSILEILGPEFTAEWAVRFESKMGAFLTETEQKLNTAKLLAPPSTPPSKLITGR